MSAEHSELIDSARQVLGEAGLAASEDKTWPLIVELGWLLAAVPEDLGGLDQGLSAACAIHKEIGAGLASAPYLPATLALEAIGSSGLPNSAELIDRFISADFATACLAQSSLSVSDGKLSGVSNAVQSADRASHLLIFTAAQDLVALAPLRQAGVEVVSRPTWDVSRRLFDVKFSNAALDESLVLARGEKAAAIKKKIASHRDFALAADSVGGAQAIFNMTVEYLQTRKQFGRPLAMFQALKHRCADLKTQIAAAEALLLDSLNRLDEGDDAIELAGKMAKLHACDVYSKVVEESIQLHGGIGMTSEYPCHLFVKRALLNAHLGRRSDSYELDIADATLAAL